MTRPRLTTAVVFTLAVAAACGGERRTSTTTAAGGTQQGRGKAVTIKGSDTMVILGQRFAEEYMRQNPGVVIQVNGGGSGTGIAALINGTVDLAQSSRPMKSGEKEDVEKRRNAKLNETPVALDALAVFVHESNPVKELSIDQLAQIYTGKITNWSQIGGPNATIVLYGRENSSGTYEYFKEHVLQKADFAPRTQTLAGTAAVINAVARDRNSIGYGGIAYAKGVRAIGVKEDAASPAVEPTEANVANGSYPISRYLYFYWIDSASPDLVSFVQWATSPDGQKLVENVGYFPLSEAPPPAS
ncbi:MAG TPA: phosphate ABC transporter substrate-binding protein [Thermoanaerobaculia bacterium]|nr:phosphate ABC transporter substrate-binding protein [Thermoanaerobaculia bacterium]